jgi:TolA-binding protein
MKAAHPLAALFLGAALLAPLAGHAALFEDDEARRAILELRQRADAQRQISDRQVEDLRRATGENEQLRRSMLDLQNQIESLRGELARLRGTDEQLTRDVTELQRRQKDLAQGVEDRLRKVEPTKISVDGRDFQADPTEQRDFEAALAVFRKGDFAGAQGAFNEFIRRWPQSALGNFRQLLQQAPEHARAPEAVLSIANCQIELKDNAGARKTLDDLVKAYPQSEAAGAARERIARLR